MESTLGEMILMNVIKAYWYQMKSTFHELTKKISSKVITVDFLGIVKSDYAFVVLAEKPISASVRMPIIRYW